LKIVGVFSVFSGRMHFKTMEKGKNINLQRPMAQWPALAPSEWTK
jgi:hypothetical protein